MLAKRETSAPSRISVRYYLWSVDGPWRIPNRLHYDLIDGKLALPQYAASKQKVLEIFARRISASTYSLRGRGSIFSFDEKGYLERERAEEIMGIIVEQARQKLKGGNIISIEPTLSDVASNANITGNPPARCFALSASTFKRHLAQCQE